MRDFSREFPVEKMCKVLKVSRSAYYESRHLMCSRRDHENKVLLSEIRRIHAWSRASYGSPRIHKELVARGFKASEGRVARLMHRHGIRAVRPKKFVATTDSRHGYPVKENMLKRDFKATAPGKAWVSDITYIRTGQGWLYLTMIMDLYDRKVVGWSLSKDMTVSNTSVAAWRMAVNNRPIDQQLIFHSDRGIQYACKEFSTLLGTYPGVHQSMSRKGDCWDNAVAESFFKTLKTEHVHRHRFQTRKQAAQSVFEWIETWYNRKRRHSTLDYMTIEEFNNTSKCKMAA